MLYDLARELPPPGSLLESVFLLVALRKRESEVLHTEALCVAAAASQSGQVDLIKSILAEYKNSMLPFLAAEKRRGDEDMKKTLKEWTDKVMFKVKPLWRATDGMRLKSQLRRGAEKTRQAEELRRQKSHRRI